MTKESTDFLLGCAFSLLTRYRSQLIKNQDREGLLLTEDEYLSLSKSIEKVFNHKTLSEIDQNGN